jgi:hypothetical protein
MLVACRAPGQVTAAACLNATGQLGTASDLRRPTTPLFSSAALSASHQLNSTSCVLLRIGLDHHHHHHQQQQQQQHNSEPKTAAMALSLLLP